MDSPILFPSGIQELSHNPVYEYITQTIHHYEKWKKVATKVASLALYTIALSLCCSATLYIAPTLPIVGVFFLALASVFSATEGMAYPRATYGLSILLPAAVGLSIQIGKVIYTPQIFVINLIATAIICIPTAVVGVLCMRTQEVFSHTLNTLNMLRREVESMERNRTYRPPNHICEEINRIIQQVCIKPYSQGKSVLSCDVEQMLQQTPLACA